MSSESTDLVSESDKATSSTSLLPSGPSSSSELPPARSENTPPDPSKCMIFLVSGYGAFWWTMLGCKMYLRHMGWPNTHIFAYNSKSLTILEHGQKLAEALKQYALEHPDHQIFMYCTSMGNLVMRSAMKLGIPPQVTKHVLVAPPWRGTEWGRYAHTWKIGRWYAGDGCGAQLRTTAMDGFNEWGHHPSSIQTLVIYASSNLNPFIQKPNDGTICHDETLLHTPHYRHLIPWGVHHTLNLTPSVWLASHQFFSNQLQSFSQHPGLDALNSSTIATSSTHDIASSSQTLSTLE